MKKLLTTIVLAISATLAFAGPDIELGPNKGRVIALSADKSARGEITLKDGTFHVSLLDKDKKVIPSGEATLAVSGGTREKSAKLEVTKTETGFSFPAVKSGEWLIFQFAPKEGAEAFTSRVVYNGAHFFSAHHH